MTSRIPRFTRRYFAGICLGALFSGRRRLFATEDAVLTWKAKPDASTGSERRYRADAQVIVLSIPILHRTGVGDGATIWRESTAGDGEALRFLEFTGRSAPERAAGLNRFGFIQELSRTADRTHTESIYFGLMTSSPEESAADARKALQSNAKEVSFSVIQARIAAGSIETADSRFLAPARMSAVDRDALIETARQSLLSAPSKTEKVPAEAMPQPFLHAIADLVSRPDASSHTQYAYSGRRYSLRMDRSADPKATADFRARHLISPTATVARVSGKLCREGGNKPIDFRLWIEEGVSRPLPLRIEYQPKSYLRLAFEALG
jgi:hypothetical protein